MQLFLSLAVKVFNFLTQEFMPFMVNVPDSFKIPYLRFPASYEPQDYIRFEYLDLPWIFGNISPIELVLVAGVIAFACKKILKLFAFNFSDYI